MKVLLAFVALIASAFAGVLGGYGYGGLGYGGLGLGGGLGLDYGGYGGYGGRYVNTAITAPVIGGRYLKSAITAPVYGERYVSSAITAPLYGGYRLGRIGLGYGVYGGHGLGVGYSGFH